MTPEPLYRRLLGSRFDQLHPTLQHFHTLPNVFGVGRFRVRRSPRRLVALAAALFGLPASTDAAEVLLTVTRVGAGERWVRSFDGRPFVSMQTARRGVLIEQAGPTYLEFALDVLNGGMVFRSERVWLLGVALPERVAPAIHATVTAAGAGWATAVRVSVPFLGTLLEDEGEVIPQWTPHSSS